MLTWHLGCRGDGACRDDALQLLLRFSLMALRSAGILESGKPLLDYRDPYNGEILWTLPRQKLVSELPQRHVGRFLFPDGGMHLGSAVTERGACRRPLATCFGVGEAAAGLRSASDFLFSIDSGRAWDQFQELFKTPAVLAKYDKDFEYWVAEATDANNDLLRAKGLLQQALADQAPQPEDEQTVIDQD